MRNLPDTFIPRREFQEIKDALLGKCPKTVALTGSGMKAAMQGMGGIGKTVLATAIAHDKEIRERFSDGIVWITLGKSPKETDFISHINSIVRCLFGKSQAFQSLLEAKEALKKLLSDKSFLLILDDLWEVLHAAPFEIIGEQGCLLITTRKMEVVRGIRAKGIRIDFLEQDQAKKLLSNILDLSVEELPQIAEKVARECGYLPIALSMIGVLIPSKGWDWALYRLQNADLEKINQQFSDYPYPDLLKALQVSVEALDEEAQRRLYDLAVFPEDVFIPMETVHTLWNFKEPEKYRSPFDTKDTLDLLVDNSLVLKNDEKRYYLHDLVRDYIRNLTGDITGLHEGLIGAYGSKCPGGWHEGNNDGYFFQFLPYHLEASGKRAECKGLLTDFRWIQAKLKATDVNAILADYENPVFEDEEEIQMIKGAIRLSSHVLNQDKTQLGSQLYSRLLEFKEKTIRNLRDQIMKYQEKPWFRSMHTSLTPPGGPLIRTLQGHSASVESVTITPDGKNAISASDDNTLKFWNLESGKEIRTFQGHSASVRSVAITPDGKCAISASYDKTLKLWNLESGNEIRTFQGHSASVNSVAITPDGKSAISASWDNTLKLWNLESGKEIRTFQGHSSLVRSVAITPDGKSAISASYDKTLKLWNLESGMEIRTFQGHSAWVNSVAISPDRKSALSASWDNTLKLWNLESGNEIRTLKGHSDSVYSVAITPDGKTAISASYDKTLKLWNLESGNEIRTLKGHSASVYSVAITPDGKTAISASDDNTLKLWNLESGNEIRTLKGHSAPVDCVAISPDGKYAISGSRDNTLKLWHLENGKEICTFKGHSTWINCVAISPDGKYAISASDDTLKLWNLESGKEIPTLKGHSDSVWSVAITPDGKYAISASWKETLKIWNIETGKVIRTLKGHSAPVLCVAISPDGKTTLSSSSDKTLKLWNLESGKEIRTLKGHSDSVNIVAMTPDGKTAISASSDKTLNLWDLETGKNLATFSGEGAILCVAVSPDGKKVVAGERSGIIHFLELVQ